MSEPEKLIELIPVDEGGRGRGGRRGGRGGRRGGGRGRFHEKPKLDEINEEEVLDSDNTEEKEESSDLITGENKGRKINRLLKKNSKENEEIMKAEMEQKKRFVKSYGKCELIRKSFKFSLQNWKFQMYNQLSTFINQMFSIFLPASEAKLVTAITSLRDYEALKSSAKIYIILLTVKLIVSELMQFFAYKFIKAEALGYRNLVMENVSQKDIEFFDVYKTGELKERITSSEECLNNNFLFKSITLVQHLGKFIFVTYYLFSFTRGLTIAYIITFIVKFIWDQLMNNYFEFRNFRKRMKNRDLYSNSLQEFLSNIRLIKSFATEEFELKRLMELKNKLNRPIFDIQGFFNQIGQFIQKISETVILFIVGKRVIMGEMTFGDYTLFQNYSGQMKNTFNQIKNSYEEYRKMFEGWTHFFEIYDFKPKIISRKNFVPEKVEGEIEFKDVTFAYPLKPDVNVLRNLSTKIEKGKVVAIVGHSGSGKTTISNLIQRFYDPTGGCITLDGVDIRDFNLKWLRRAIGFVAQEPTLYSTTIEDNVTYGVTEYTMEDFHKVCELANVDKFVSDKSLFPSGYKTLVGEKGARVSGGQKQRIAIARALMKNSKILVFDEATSALDAESENEVQSAIDNIVKTRGVTTIIIAHRLSTIKNADYILFMDKGQIIEKGTHKELTELNGEYKKLVQRQLEKVD
jgi:ABC-type multidrug transport system fused ATPase/permease subunit